MDGVVLVTGDGGASHALQAVGEASGKSTVAQALTGEAEAQLRLRHRLSAATADAYAQAGFTAVVPDVVLGAALEASVDLVRTRPLHVVVLAPDAGTVAVREAGRRKTGYGAGSGWTVADLDEELRLRTPRIGLWLDTGELTVGQTGGAILAGRERARVV
ncbi:phosphotransferase [Streptomyces sp. NBC_01275]|uniref:phosphotransferase n=1 Tax=Streptomyces sp. NBC_01275 TaxID=2903807 RepID=UPI00224E8F8D|nr:phosphotransferase [Streptomyces sp. NBC_01275]MCX4762503.1 phosphotransferase [Streptomyces sp. NBC_01275]